MTLEDVKIVELPKFANAIFHLWNSLEPYPV